MKWFRIYAGTFDHPKFRHFHCELGCSEAEAVGILASLWDAAAQRFEDGDITSLVKKPGMMRAACRCSLPGDEVADAMLEAGFIDEKEGQFVLHDWLEVHRKYFAERHRKSKQTVPVPRKGRGRGAEPRRHSAEASISKSDVLNSSGTTKVPTSSPKSAGKPAWLKVGEYCDGFAEFWNAYPRRIEKKGAHRKWIKCISDGATMADLTRAAQHYAQQCKAEGRDGTKIKHPATFLGPDDHWKEYVDSAPVIPKGENENDRANRKAEKDARATAEKFRLMREESERREAEREAAGIPKPSLGKMFRAQLAKQSADGNGHDL